MTYKRRIHKCGFASLPFLPEREMKILTWNPDTPWTTAQHRTNSTFEKHRKVSFHNHSEKLSVTISVPKTTNWKHKQAKSVKPHPYFYAVTLL